MSIRNRVLILVALGASLTLAACGSNRPGAVVKRFITNAAMGNADVALPLLSSRLREPFGDDKLRSELSRGESNTRSNGGLERVEILIETVEEDGVHASVRARATYGNGTTGVTDFELVREAGDWKIDVQHK